MAQGRRKRLAHPYFARVVSGGCLSRGGRIGNRDDRSVRTSCEQITRTYRGHAPAKGGVRSSTKSLEILERAMGFEPTTPTLARLASPQTPLNSNERGPLENGRFCADC